MSVVELLVLANEAERLVDRYKFTPKDAVEECVCKHLEANAHNKVIKDMLIVLVTHSLSEVESWYYDLTSNLNNDGDIDES